MSLKRLFVSMCFILYCFLLNVHVSCDEVMIEADFQQVIGAFNRLSGVQGSPYPILASDTVNIKNYKKHHIGLCRFPQDCYPNTLTLSAIFPNENADPSNESNYNFSGIDRHIIAAQKANCDILWQASYDIGRSSDVWKGINLGGRPPRNIKRWCDVVLQCLRHFNNGWARGYNYTVKYVEFINEPTDLGGFKGEDVYRLPVVFCAFLKTIEYYNKLYPHTPVKAVGPGIPFSQDQWHKWEPRFRKLFTLLKKKNLSLPILSFHTYGEDTSPVGNTKLAASYRALLDEFGMKNTKLWNTEWQGGDFLKKLYKGKVKHLQKYTLKKKIQLYKRALAVYALSCKIRWQGIVDGSCYYRASQRAFPPHIEKEKGKRRLNPFFKNNHSMPLALQEKFTYIMKKHTPYRCKILLSKDNGLITALATRSKSGDRMSILLCNLSHVSVPVMLKLALPENVTDIHINEHSFSSKSLNILKKQIINSESRAKKYWTYVKLPPVNTVILNIEAK